MLKLWNTATRSLQEFKPLKPGKVGMYTCGPTVYWDASIGSFRTFMFEDVLLRTLELEGYDVTRVLNITDVGHLTDDADAGEDKMEKASKKEGITAWDVAKKYTDLFLRDAEKLNVRMPPAPYLSKATDHIPEQIELVKLLEEKGFTYRTSDGIYFDTAKFPAYGALGGQKLEDKEEGARVEINEEKRNKSDFALWKFSPADTKRQMEWDSPWGVGFPGWHVECSAMAHKYLGQPIDIHCGGMDLIPVHHENEIAQSEAAYGGTFVDYWMHGEFLLIDGGKMSKSLGNIYTVRDVEAKGFDPLALRFFYLGAHYRQKENFTWDGLQAAQNALTKLRNVVRGWDVGAKAWPGPAADGIPEGETRPSPLQEEFRSALEDDLNTSKALAVVWKLVDADMPSSTKSATLSWMDNVLGLSLDDVIAKPVSVPEDIQKIAQEREIARSSKDWAGSDRLRDLILARGWLVEDTKDGPRITPARM